MNKIKVKLLSLMLALALALTACGNKDDKKMDENKTATEENKASTEEKKDEEKKDEEKKDEEKKDEEKKPEMKVMLSDWDGKWNSIQKYGEKEEFAKAFEDKAKAEKMTAEEAKKAFNERRNATFGGIEINGDNVTLYEGFPEEGKMMGKPMMYKYVTSKDVMHGASTLSWNVFETADSEDYKYIVLMPVHGEEEITHFHMRYGKSYEELLTDESWFPTFVKPSSTTQQVYDEIAE